MHAQASIEKPEITEFAKVKALRGIPYMLVFNPEGELVIGERVGYLHAG